MQLFYAVTAADRTAARTKAGMEARASVLSSGALTRSRPRLTVNASIAYDRVGIAAMGAAGLAGSATYDSKARSCPPI